MLCFINIALNFPIYVYIQIFVMNLLYFIISLSSIFNGNVHFPSTLYYFLGLPLIFSFIVLFQGCFGSMGIVQCPKALKEAVKSPLFRFLYVNCIAYTATTNLQISIFATFCFFLFLHLLRTEGERKRMKYYYI